MFGFRKLLWGSAWGLGLRFERMFWYTGLCRSMRNTEGSCGSIPEDTLRVPVSKYPVFRYQEPFRL